MYAQKLKRGDEIRVIAPSRSLSIVRQEVCDEAIRFLENEGFRVTFSKNSREIDEFNSSSVDSRVSDLHEAFLDDSVKAVLTCIGGFNVNQILDKIDYSIIAAHPKILCGYSDITALINAIYAKTGLVTYHGPHFSTFGFETNRDYTKNCFLDCAASDNAVTVSPSPQAEKYHVIQHGHCEGQIIGGNLCTLNLLQGTPYMPDLADKILFIEDDNIMGKYFPYEFDRNLQSLLQLPHADKIKGIVFGRFDESWGLSVDVAAKIVKGKISDEIPVLYNVDFGHVTPIMTFPIGGTAAISADSEHAEITVTEH